MKAIGCPHCQAVIGFEGKVRIGEHSPKRPVLQMTMCPHCYNFLDLSGDEPALVPQEEVWFLLAVQPQLADFVLEMLRQDPDVPDDFVETARELIERVRTRGEASSN